MLGIWMIITKCYRAHRDSNNNRNYSDNVQDDTIPLGVPLVDVGCKYNTYLMADKLHHVLLDFAVGLESVTSYT